MEIFKRSKIANNAMWLIGAKVVQSILSFIIGMLTARYLGPSNYGLIGYAASIAAFFQPVTNLGLTSVVVQELVNDPDKEGEIMGTSTALSVTSSVICILVMSAGVSFFNRDRLVIWVCALYSLSLFFRALEIIVYWFQARLMSKYSSIVSLAAYLGLSAYKAFLLITHKNVMWFAVSTSLDCFLVAISLLVIYRKKGGGRFAFSAERARHMLRRSKHYIIPNLMVVVFAETDKIMLKHMLGVEFTGYYNAAVTMCTVTAFVFSAVIDSFRPDLFEKKKHSQEGFEKGVSRLYSLIIYLSLAQCAAVTVLSGFIIRIVYGGQYLPAAGALRICIWYTMFSYIGAVRNIWLLAENHQKLLLPINISGALANVFFNYLLIPRLGINGAALASLGTQFFTNVVIGYIIAPIRENNRLMVRGLNPRYITEMFVSYRGK